MKTVTILNASDRFIVDSSGWVEYLGGGPKEAAFAPYFNDVNRILLPTIVIFEVHKKVLREHGRNKADVFVSQAFSFGTRIINLDLDISITASAVSLEESLPMADAIIYACACRHRADLITSDSHFKGRPGVTFI
jgi:toxin FitB